MGCRGRRGLFARQGWAQGGSVVQWQPRPPRQGRCCNPTMRETEASLPWGWLTLRSQPNPHRHTDVGSPGWSPEQGSGRPTPSGVLGQSNKRRKGGHQEGLTTGTWGHRGL